LRNEKSRGLRVRVRTKRVEALLRREYGSVSLIVLAFTSEGNIIRSEEIY